MLQKRPIRQEKLRPKFSFVLQTVERNVIEEVESRGGGGKGKKGKITAFTDITGTDYV